jgi:hypothetical protein
MEFSEFSQDELELVTKYIGEVESVELSGWRACLRRLSKKDKENIAPVQVLIKA